MHAICRDCLQEYENSAVRCGSCGGTRLIAHAELHKLCIAHIDCDAFYAAVEKRDYPELQNRPLIIGGRKRGVVTTACYIARTKGVRSAMPMFQARKLCPQAVIVPPNFAKYVEAGRAVRKKMFELTDQVQPLSIDEAFLDLSDLYAKGESPARALVAFAAEVEAEFRITVSIGLSHNKLMAKIASDCDKPKGMFLIGKADTEAFLADKPVSILWGVGKATASRLAKRGINTVGQLRALDQVTLDKQHGVFGKRLFEFARGIDNRKIRERTKSKSVSTETTFFDDLKTLEELEPHLKRLCERLSQRLVKSRKAGRGVTLKLKTKDFQLLTRSQAMKTATCLPDTLFETGLALMSKELDGRAFRLLGIGVHDLVGIEEADWSDLADPERAAQHQKLLEQVFAE